jgi:mRNA interferase MazF
VIPLTGAASALRFKGTVEIQPTSTNGLQKSSVALVFQLRAVDRKRILERIGSLSDDNLKEIHAMLDALMGRAAAT